MILSSVVNLYYYYTISHSSCQPLNHTDSQLTCKHKWLQRGLYTVVVVDGDTYCSSIVVVESVVVVESIVVESHCVRSVVVDYTSVVVARLSTVNQL